jgi:hypothetical protein
MYQIEQLAQGSPHSGLRNGGVSPRVRGSVKDPSSLRLVSRWAAIASTECVRSLTYEANDDYKQWSHPITREDIVSAWLIAVVALLTLLVV